MRYQNPLGTIDRETAEITVNTELAQKLGEKYAQIYHDSCVTTTHPVSYHPVFDPFLPRIGPWLQNEAGVMLDFIGDVATRVLGSHHPEVEKTISDALSYGIADFKGAGTDFYYQSAPNLPVTQDLAAQIIEVTEELFSNKYKVFFVNTGAEATCNAAKISCYAKLLDLKSRLSDGDFVAIFDQLGIQADPDMSEVYSDYPFFGLACTGAFHGRTFGMLTHTKSKPYHKEGFPTLRWVRHVPYNDPDFNYEEIIDETPLSELIAQKRLAEVVFYHKKIPRDLFAYTIVEPVQGEGGYRVPEKSFIKRLEAMTKENGAYFITDEVQAGFARTGKFWGMANFDANPDMICSAKALHVGATIVRSDIADKIPPGKLSTTWGGGDLLRLIQGSAMIKVIREYRDPELKGRTISENVETQGEYFRSGLRAIQQEYPQVITNVRGIGLMNAVTIATPDMAECIEQRCFEKGLIILGCGKQSLRFLPPLDVRTREIDIALQVISDVISEG